MMTSGKFSSLLLNSIQVLSRVCPAFLLATMSAALHRGQSGQPSPDELSLTAAPVDMIAVSAMTPASAIRRIDLAVGDSTGATELGRRDAGEPGAEELGGHAPYGRAPRRLGVASPRV